MANCVYVLYMTALLSNISKHFAKHVLAKLYICNNFFFLVRCIIMIPEVSIFNLRQTFLHILEQLDHSQSLLAHQTLQLVSGKKKIIN